MKRKIVIEGLQAVSINGAYYADKRLGYKSEVRDWIAQVCHQLGNEPNKSAIKDLREHFNHKKHSFTVYIKYHTPKYFNKQGWISHASMDCGNVNKVLLDVLFTNAYYGTGNGLSENINHDDCFISALTVAKVPATEYKLEITVKIINLPKRVE